MSSKPPEVFTLFEMKLEDGTSHWRYQRQSDLQLVSPIFTSEECANFYLGRMPLLDDNQWKLQPKVSSKMALDKIRKNGLKFPRR